MRRPGSNSGAGPVRLTPTDFAARFEAASRALWCVAFAVCSDRTAAEDFVQEAAVVALGKLDEFDASTSFIAWMSQIVRYLALNERRKRAREKEGHAQPAFQDAAQPVVSTRRTGCFPVTSQGELRSDQVAFDDHVSEAVQGLEETARACLLLKTVMELSYKEIAQALSIPEGTAMSHVHRARQALRKKLQSASDAEHPRSVP